MVAYLRQLDAPALIGFEATDNYHRPLAYFLHAQGFELRLIPTMALARTREAMHNSWDKNDPKDAQVILHLLKTGLSQTWYDPRRAAPTTRRRCRRPIIRSRWRGPECGTASAITTFPYTFPRSSTSSVPTTATG